MTKRTTEAPAEVAATLREGLAAEAAVLERELTEIEMLITQAKGEAARHEQRRIQTTDKLAAVTGAPKEFTDLNTQLVTLTRRTAMMDAQVEVLEGKRKSMVRFREALLRHAGSTGDEGEVEAAEPAGNHAAGHSADAGTEILTPAVSRMVLAAQEDLRREIARAMHDGPAQSLTNIVLQAQIVERLVAKEPESAKGELRLLISMVQQTLEATKSFIFDVRPMVLDDLGLVPTLRRATRERGQHAGIKIVFESSGADHRLPVEVESGLFRILDTALTGYLSARPSTLSIRLDWSERVEATVTARRAGVAKPVAASEPEIPDSKDLPPALAAMLDDRRGERLAKTEADRTAAIPALPIEAWREIQQRAATIGAEAELVDEGGTLRVTTAPEPAPEVPGTTPAAAD